MFTKVRLGSRQPVPVGFPARPESLGQDRQALLINREL